MGSAGRKARAFVPSDIDSQSGWWHIRDPAQHYRTSRIRITQGLIGVWMFFLRSTLLSTIEGDARDEHSDIWY